MVKDGTARKATEPTDRKETVPYSKPQKVADSLLPQVDEKVVKLPERRSSAKTVKLAPVDATKPIAKVQVAEFIRSARKDTGSQQLKKGNATLSAALRENSTRSNTSGVSSHIAATPVNASNNTSTSSNDTQNTTNQTVPEEAVVSLPMASFALDVPPPSSNATIAANLRHQNFQEILPRNLLGRRKRSSWSTKLQY
jgi:hypothetical protein